MGHALLYSTSPPAGVGGLWWTLVAACVLSQPLCPPLCARACVRACVCVVVLRKVKRGECGRGPMHLYVGVLIFYSCERPCAKVENDANDAIAIAAAYL